ncbi:unnamed protein product [Vitrella brassicaformis CCMP3155]|uniref:Transmembrane protein n=2 Tax=Vitrella brassicaformis TaxID=1169539 RepID=A0A0G4GNS8_VITBC|nr:unnamed protein product [Vitrella brassicaformis CCMP3155]|eukprot:CEM31958.1 unnamed protein product [Vitrella brassicaformis CCMP3155]
MDSNDESQAPAAQEATSNDADHIRFSPDVEAADDAKDNEHSEAPALKADARRVTVKITEPEERQKRDDNIKSPGGEVRRHAIVRHASDPNTFVVSHPRLANIISHATDSPTAQFEAWVLHFFLPTNWVATTCNVALFHLLTFGFIFLVMNIPLGHTDGHGIEEHWGFIIYSMIWAYFAGAFPLQFLPRALGFRIFEPMWFLLMPILVGIAMTVAVWVNQGPFPYSPSVIGLPCYVVTCFIVVLNVPVSWREQDEAYRDQIVYAILYLSLPPCLCIFLTLLCWLFFTSPDWAKVLIGAMMPLVSDFYLIVGHNFFHHLNGSWMPPFLALIPFMCTLTECIIFRSHVVMYVLLIIVCSSILFEILLPTLEMDKMLWASFRVIFSELERMQLKGRGSKEDESAITKRLKQDLKEEKRAYKKRFSNFSISRRRREGEDGLPETTPTSPYSPAPGLFIDGLIPSQKAISPEVAALSLHLSDKTPTQIMSNPESPVSAMAEAPRYSQTEPDLKDVMGKVADTLPKRAAWRAFFKKKKKEDDGPKHKKMDRAHGFLGRGFLLTPVSHLDENEMVEELMQDASDRFSERSTNVERLNVLHLSESPQLKSALKVRSPVAEKEKETKAETAAQEPSAAMAQAAAATEKEKAKEELHQSTRTVGSTVGRRATYVSSHRRSSRQVAVPSNALDIISAASLISQRNVEKQTLEATDFLDLNLQEDDSENEELLESEAVTPAKELRFAAGASERARRGSRLSLMLATAGRSLRNSVRNAPVFGKRKRVVQDVYEGFIRMKRKAVRPEDEIQNRTILQLCLVPEMITHLVNMLATSFRRLHPSQGFAYDILQVRAGDVGVLVLLIAGRRWGNRPVQLIARDNSGRLHIYFHMMAFSIIFMTFLLIPHNHMVVHQMEIGLSKVAKKVKKSFLSGLVKTQENTY